jgi:diguanylate cyclase (GGDEF)-like protein/PAS domain S-box-containing protein
VFDSRGDAQHQDNVGATDFFRAQRDAGHSLGAQPPSPASISGIQMGGTGTYFGHVGRNPQTGESELYISRRLSGSDGRFAGIVFSVLPASFFESAFQKVVLGQAGAVSLLRGDGTVLARFPADPAFANADVSHSVPFLHYPNWENRSFEVRSPLDQVRRLYTCERVPHSALVLCVGTALTDVYAAWRQRATMLGGIAALLTLCIVGIAVMLNREFQHRQRVHQTALRNESLFSGALNGSAIGTALFEMDRRVSYINPALARLLGTPIEAMLGQQLSTVLGETEWPQDHLGLGRLQSGELDVYSVERQFDRSNGEVVHGMVSVTLVRDEGRQPRFFIAQIEDITSRVLATQALNEQNERLQVTLSSIADGVVTTDRSGFVRFVNPAAEAITGWSHREAVTRSITEIFALRDPDSGLPVEDVVRRALASPRAAHVSISGVLVDRLGVRREVACNAATVRTADKVMGAVLVFRDVSESHELHRKLAYNASHDALTGLPNRTAFEAELEEAVRDARGNSSQHALAFLDLDRFKIVNDTAGHRAGDALLKLIAKLVVKQVRDSDVVGRLGGDEIGVILRDCGIDEAKVVLERLTAAVNELVFVWDGRNYGVGASIGLTLITPHSESPVALLTEADVACYAAKNAGRNSVSVYSGEQSDAADWHRKIVLAAGIEEAIAEGRIFLHAQKVLPSDEDEAPRWELLARMYDRDGAPIPTSVFIPAAERYDLMGHVDRWGLTHALGEVRRAQDSGVLFPVHVNLSANSLNDPAFVPFALGLIKDSGVPTSSLTFEITETALMRNPASGAAAITALREAGIQVALDDFGIGMSSFGYLRSFPVDIVKIDGGFVVNMTESSVDRNIVKSIHQITRDLGARTVAESVENEETLAMLKHLGIDFFQGYGIHRPQLLKDVVDGEILGKVKLGV